MDDNNISEVLARNGLDAADIREAVLASDKSGPCLGVGAVVAALAKLLDQAEEHWRDGEDGESATKRREARAILAEVIR